MLMNRRNSLLMIIDVQERLASAMDDPRQVISNSARLVGAAKAMGVPFVITEQYPKGLGQTMIDVRQEAGDEAAFFSKLYFSAFPISDVAISKIEIIYFIALYLKWFLN